MFFKQSLRLAAAANEYFFPWLVLFKTCINRDLEVTFRKRIGAGLSFEGPSGRAVEGSSGLSIAVEDGSGRSFLGSPLALYWVKLVLPCGSLFLFLFYFISEKAIYPELVPWPERNRSNPRLEIRAVKLNFSFSLKRLTRRERWYLVN